MTTPIFIEPPNPSDSQFGDGHGKHTQKTSRRAVKSADGWQEKDWRHQASPPLQRPQPPRQRVGVRPSMVAAPTSIQGPASAPASTLKDREATRGWWAGCLVFEAG